jgi:Putative prokaryotic signal transducing protein
MSIECRLDRSRAAPAAPELNPPTIDVMKELLRTNNVVRLSWVQALLRDSGIESLVLDEHTSLVEGSIGAIQRRLMVLERDFARARALVAAADKDDG